MVVLLAVLIALTHRFNRARTPAPDDAATLRLGLNLLAQEYLARRPHTAAWDDTTPRDQARRMAVAALASKNDVATRDLLFEVATADELSEPQSTLYVRSRAMDAVSSDNDLHSLIRHIVLAGAHPDGSLDQGLDEAAQQQLKIIRTLQTELGDDGMRRLMALLAGTDADFALLVLRALRSRGDQ
ncbi:hypothetical protein [Kribbella deserti]|uniref:Uncharacterized protein n=1 Tax=Kribbella deserti TaxID=1926257 RepID=A0ABV6QJK6_9ACTN